MVKQHDKHGHFLGVDIRVIYSDAQTLEARGQSTAYGECTNLTARLMNSRLIRNTAGFSKQVAILRASSVWEDGVYNLVRLVKTLRVTWFPSDRVRSHRTSWNRTSRAKSHRRSAITAPS
jgi:hypothetical protein